MQSLTEQFVKEAEKRILTGEWAIGMKVPPLRTLAEEFNVSRSVINAAIAELCNNGFLLTVPRKYIIVADWRQSGNFAVLQGLIENGLSDINFYKNIFEGRMTIEKAIVYSAARERTDEDIRLLNNVIAEEEKASSPAEMAEGDMRFHHALSVASHNLVYTIILNSFNKIASKLTYDYYEKLNDNGEVVEAHKFITSSLVEKNADLAVDRLCDLLSKGEKEILNNIKL